MKPTTLLLALCAALLIGPRLHSLAQPNVGTYGLTPGANCGSFCSYNDDFGMTHADCVRWCRDEDISISLAEVCRDYDQVPKDEQGDCVKYYASIANPGQNRP